MSHILHPLYICSKKALFLEERFRKVSIWQSLVLGFGKFGFSIVFVLFIYLFIWGRLCLERGAFFIFGMCR